MRYHHFGSGRYVLRLDPGEEVVASLTKFAEEREVVGATLHAIGSLDRAVLSFLDPKDGAYLRRTFDERMEIGSLTGFLGRDGKDPFLHVHAVLSPRELLAYAGHLHEATVGVVVEVVLTTLPGRLGRIVDPATGFARLVLPGEKGAESAEESAAT